ncbi:MAG: hypothetical protein C0524_13925 [Rhodobacter sp.]|nr:hypothetical protein [Rhodobacter sp.]
MSIGAAALAAGMPATEAAAQEPFDVTIDGGIAFSDFSNQTFEDKIGSGLSFGRDVGFFGSIAVSRQISDAWDWRVSGSFIGMRENTLSVEFDDDDDDDDDDSVSLDQQLSGFSADVGIGRKIMMGKTEVRLGFGLVGASYNQEIAQLFVFDGKGIGFETDIEYRGFGAKLSADVAHPISADGRLTLIGGGSVAPTNGDFELGPSGSSGITLDGSALLSSAYLGLSMQRNETTALRMGVRVDRFDGKVDGGGFGILDEAATTTSAFVGLNIQF